jgi:predicted nucleic acid-binding protein
MILCDTNILIEFYKGNPQILQVLHQAGPDNLSISVITAGELYTAQKTSESCEKSRNISLRSGKFPWMKMSPPSSSNY